MKYKVKEHVTHQNIGGKEIKIDFEVSIDEVLSRAAMGVIGCYNFMTRRPDINLNCNKKLYYGHIYNRVKYSKNHPWIEGWLGYVVCEDELEKVPDNYFDKKKGILHKVIDLFKLARRMK